LRVEKYLFIRHLRFFSPVRLPLSSFTITVSGSRSTKVAFSPGKCHLAPLRKRHLGGKTARVACRFHPFQNNCASSLPEYACRMHAACSSLVLMKTPCTPSIIKVQAIEYESWASGNGA
jgi:hypothetical protein